MYKKADRQQLSIEEFFLPFGGQLNAENRWVKLAQLMPWDFIEDIYAEKFKNENPDGNVPIPARVAYGSLHIKAEEASTDERTLLFIAENPYAQYFLGFKAFQDKPPFDLSRPAKAGLGECSLFGRILTHRAFSEKIHSGGHRENQRRAVPAHESAEKRPA